MKYIQLTVLALLVSFSAIAQNKATEKADKLFKTLNIEGDAPWGATLQTDLQSSGFIDQSWFEKKEAAYFAFVRNNAIGEFALRSLNGIGRSFQVTGGVVIKFSINPLISIGNIISIGDLIYFFQKYGRCGK